MVTGYMELLKPSGEKARVPAERYNHEYLLLKDELNSPTSKKGKFFGLFRSEIEPAYSSASQIEERAIREFNVESGPIFWKPFVMDTIHRQLSSGERLSFEQMVINVQKDQRYSFVFDSNALNAKLSLLGGLLVLTEQNLLQRTNEEGRWVYSLVSIRDAPENIEKLTSAFLRLKRGQKLETQILC